MSFLDALTPEAQRREEDIYEAFHNPDGTRKQDVKQIKGEVRRKTFTEKMKVFFGE